MNSWIRSLSLALIIASISAFAPRAAPKSHVALMALPPAPVVQFQESSQPAAFLQSSPLTQGVENYVVGSSTQLVSLKERVAPTAEEIQAKKDSFNFWFWGGGFVAPFLATFYYFGFQFWKR